MKVAQRLYLAALPSVVGVITVAALAYWGQYSRTVPEIFLLIALAATVITLVLSWANVRYVAMRVERLARSTGPTRGADAGGAVAARDFAVARDELDVIEGTVTDLTGAVRLAEDVRVREIARSEQQTRKRTELLLSVATSALQRLDEVRLPLHILLENHFGDLNENQEEMLGAARAAAERIDDELEAVAELAGLELGNMVLRRDRVFPADILNAILPTLRAHAAARELDLQAEVAPLVPAIHVDAARLQRALLVLLSDAIDSATKQSHLALSLRGEPGSVQVKMEPASELKVSARTVLARRLIESFGGEVSLHANTITIGMPA